MDNNTWPDPARPGVPMNPERDGWHWLRTPDGNDVPYEWCGPGEYEWCGPGECERGRWPAYWVPVDADNWQPAKCTYIAPVLTPAEVDARVQQARRDALEEAAREIDGAMRELFGDADEYKQGWNAGLEAGAAAIRALKGEGDE